MPVGNPVTDLSTSGNFVPVTRTLTINGVSYDLSADRSWSIASPGGGSVTSVAMTVPTGFSVAGSPITTAGTLAVTFASGYALPTTVKQSNWDDAYTFVSNFPSQTGNNGKFLYTSGSVLSWQPVLQNPMSNYGEMIFGGTSGVPSVITPNSSTTKLYLQQVGNGTTPFAPSWGGIISSDITGAALTKTDDTNVTLTLGGTPGNSVLNAVSLTLGWSGQLSAGRGGTGTSGVTGIMLGNSTAPVTGVTGIGGQILRANPSTGAYEFWTPTYLESPMNQLGDIIYGGAGGQPLRLGANNTANNMYLRSVSAGAPSWASIQGGDIVGAGITRTNDTNVQITLGGATTDGLLRAVSLTMGWAGQLSVPRGGTGVGTLTGVVIGNGIGVMTGVVGTAGQLLRRDATNTFYEFFTPTYLSNPFTAANQLIYSNSANAPLVLNPNATAQNRYLRSVSGGAPSWELVTGADITGEALSANNDTNVTIALSGTPATALLRATTLTMGWTGVLSPTRGGTGVNTLTGVVIGNGIGTMTGVVGTAEQLLRRNAANTAYEFFTPNFLSNPMTTGGDMIVANSAGAPLRLPGSVLTTRRYLSQIGDGTFVTSTSWQSISGADITGAALTSSNDTNVTITLGGTPATSLLRAASITMGWSGTLSVGRGGSGASTLTGVLIGNGTSAFTGVAGTANQMLRRNSANTDYEFFTPTFTTGSGTTNFVPIWTNSTTLGNSPLSITGGEANFGSNKLVAGNTSATNGSIILQDNYFFGHLGNIGTMYSGGNLMMGYGVTPSTSSATGFLSSVFISGVPLPRSAVVAGEDIFFYTASAQSIAIGSSVSMTERIRLTNAGNLGIGNTPSHKLDVNGNIGISGNKFAGQSGSYHIISDQLNVTCITIGGTDPTNAYDNTSHLFRSRNGSSQYASIGTSGVQTSNHFLLPSANYITWGGVYGANIPSITGTSGTGAFLSFHPSGSSSGEKMRLSDSGQLRLNGYNSITSFTGIVQGYLAFTSGGNIITTATPGGVSGTQNYLAKFDSTGIAVGNSRIVDDGTNFLLNGATSVVTGLNLVGNFSATESQGGSILLRRSAIPVSGDILGLIDGLGITTGSTYQMGAGIEFRASQNWNSTSAGTNVVVQTAPDNTIAPADMFVFLNNGAVRFIGRTSNPIGAAAGTMYYNSSANNMRYFNGTTWITF